MRTVSLLLVLWWEDGDEDEMGMRRDETDVNDRL